jgi:hypothetical protein
VIVETLAYSVINDGHVAWVNRECLKTNCLLTCLLMRIALVANLLELRSQNLQFFVG